jgi:hypothetical protein
MNIEIDGNGQKYIEVPLPNSEHVRTTLINDSWAGGPGIRVQIRQTNGQLRKGPEIPAAQVSQVVAAVIELLADKHLE